jgi:RimJ/RimL family protein N-acetyltransferase
MLGPTLETDRLILRPPGAEDLGPWAAFMADPDAARFIGGAQSAGGAWRSLATMAGAWAVFGFGNFSVIEKTSGRWIGRCGPWYPAGWPGPEIGWAFDRSAWGQGYATEAARRCLTYAYEVLGWDRVVHPIDPANTASIAVAQRIGSTLLGPTELVMSHVIVTADLYGQTRAEWEARSAVNGGGPQRA